MQELTLKICVLKKIANISVSKELKILLVSPRGFCAGVDRAIEIVKKTLI